MVRPEALDGLEPLLAKLGISKQFIRRIRFGGVVGKQALVATAGLAGLGVLAFRTHSQSLQWGCVVAITLVVVYVVAAIGFHGHRHPIEATLEGGEIVAWQQIQQEYAAKGVDRAPAAPLVAEGIGSRPLAEQGKGEPR